MLLIRRHNTWSGIGDKLGNNTTVHWIAVDNRQRKIQTPVVSNSVCQPNSSCKANLQRAVVFSIAFYSEADEPASSRKKTSAIARHVHRAIPSDRRTIRWCSRCFLDCFASHPITRQHYHCRKQLELSALTLKWTRCFAKTSTQKTCICGSHRCQ